MSRFGVRGAQITIYMGVGGAWYGGAMIQWDVVALMAGVVGFLLLMAYAIAELLPPQSS